MLFNIEMMEQAHGVVLFVDELHISSTNHDMKQKFDEEFKNRFDVMELQSLSKSWKLSSMKFEFSIEWSIN